ncbi:MAG: hypothetical protein WC415_00465 [Patescibacteria group bacterium]
MKTCSAIAPHPAALSFRYAPLGTPNTEYEVQKFALTKYNNERKFFHPNLIMTQNNEFIPFWNMLSVMIKALDCLKTKLNIQF